MESRIVQGVIGNIGRGVTSTILMAGLISVLLTGVISSIQIPSAKAATGINHTINFQGKIVNTDGTNVASSTYSFTFKLYTIASGGTAVWTETKTLAVNDGIFQTNLGDVTSLPGSVDFNSDSIFLGINFNPGGGYDGEMSPRIQFTAAAYAFNSEKLGGIAAAGFAQINPASAQAGSLNIGTTVQAGTSLQAPLVDTATGVGLNIGTGTATSVTIGRATSTNAVSIQGSNASNWVVTGASGTTTLGFAAPSGNTTLTLPNVGGTVCTTVASTCSATYQTSSGSGSYIAKNANDNSTASYVGTLLALSNTSTGAAGVLSLANSGTGSALSIAATANPTSGNALIFANTTATTPSGNLIDLQVAGVSKFSVDAATATLTVAGNFTNGTNTVTTGSLAASNAVRAVNSANNNGYFSKTTLAGTGGWAANDVVVLDGSASGVDSTTARDIRVYGVAIIARTAGQGGDVAIAGNYQVNATTAAVAVGDQLVTSGTSGQVMTDNNATTGILGTATTAKAGGSTGLVGVSIRPVTGVLNPNFQAGNLTTTGTISSGLINGQTISSAANFTGTVTAATSLLSTLLDTPTAGGTLAIGMNNATGGINLNQNVTVAAGKSIATSNAAATGTVFSSQVSGDTTSRLIVGADGKLSFGPGNAAVDVSLFRASAGQLQTNNSLAVSGALSAGALSFGNTRLSVSTINTGTVGAVIRGATSQAADLLDLQDSSGYVGGAFGATGNALTLGRSSATGNNYAGSVTLNDGTADTFGATLNTSTLTASRTLSLPDASGTLCTTLTCATGSTGSYIQNQSAAIQTAVLNIQSGNANTTTAQFVGAASANVDIISALTTGNGGLRVSNVGTLITTAGAALQNGNGNTLPALRVTNSLNTTVAAYVQGAASQSGNLLELRDSNSLVNGSFNGPGNQLTLGRIAASGVVTAGALVFGDGTTDSFGATLNTSTLTASRSISLPDAGGTICTTVATTCSGTYSAGASVSLQASSPGAPQTGNFNISGSGIAPTLLTSTIDTAASGSLSIGGGTNTTGIVIGKAASTTTITGTSISLNAATVATTATSIALFNTNATTVTGLGASTNTTLGANSGSFAIQNPTLTVGASGVVSFTGAGNAGVGFNGANFSASSTNSGTATFRSGNVSGTTSSSGAVVLRSGNSTTSGNTGTTTVQSGDSTGGNSGSVTIDSGAHGASGASGNILIGQTNAGAVLIGNATAQFTMQGAASTSTIVASGGANSTTVAFAAPTAAVTYTFGAAATGSYNICTTVAVSCSGTYQASGNYLAQNPAAAVTSTSNFTGAQYSFVQNNSGAATALALQSAGTNAAFSVTQSSNPVAGQALILANNTNGTPSGNLLDLQTNATSKFSVTSTGAVATAGTINAQTISAAANFTGTITSASAITVTSGGIGVTGNSTITGTLGGITGLTVVSGGASITGGVNLNTGGITNTGSIAGATTIAASTSVSAPVISSADTATASTNSGAVSFRSGNATGTGSNSGNVTVDAGTATGTAGNVSIGTSTAANVSVGRVGAALSLQGSATSTIGIGNGTSTTTINFANPGANVAYTLGTAAAGSYNICTTVATSCSSVYQAAGSYITKNAVDTSSATLTAGQTLLTLSNGGSTSSSVLQVNNGTATGNGLYVTAAASPSAGNALLVANNTAGTPSGNLLDLQVSGTSKFSVNYQGNVTSAGTLNGQTISAAAAFTGTVSVATGLTVTTGGAAITGASTVAGTLGGITGLTVVSGGASVTGGINVNAGGVTNAGAVSGLSSLQYNTNGTLDTAGSNTITIGGSNASGLVVGRTGITTTVSGTLQVGSAVGTGATVNNGSTVNSTYTMANLPTGGWDAGGAAATVDKYTYISANQTTAAQTLTIPSPTASTQYGRLVYITNIGTASFTLLTTTIGPGSTATLIWANTNGAASWTFAGADGSGILNQNTADQSANFRINGTGRANVSFIAPTFDSITGALNIGTTNATTTTVGSSVATANSLIFESGATGSIAIGNAATAHTIAIGTGGAVQGVTLGSLTTTSSTTINGGTGNINFNVNQSTAGVTVKTVTTNSATAFQVQNSSGVALLLVDTATSAIRVGDTTNYVQFTAGTREPILNGTARHTKNIHLVPEYAGAVLDNNGASSITGTMTAAVDNTTTVDTTYYKWTTNQSSAQTYDILVNVPVPDDWAGWTGNPTFKTYVTTSGSITATITEVNGTTNDPAVNNTTITSTAGSWFTYSAGALASTGYTAGGTMTIRIHMLTSNSNDVRMSDIIIPYASKF